MRKMLAIIVVLIIIFISMVIYKKVRISNNENNNVSVEEIGKIEEKIKSIYMWKEVTGEALPEFQDINNANEKWIWEVVKNNLQNYEVTYEEIEEEAKLLFGEKFNKQFPKEGNESFIYNSETNKYTATEVELDQEEDSFLLENIVKTESGYEVEILEYLEDYSQENSVVIKNTNEEEIGRVGIDDSETKVQEIVKNNKDRFIKKKIYIKNENNNLVIERVEKC